MSPRAFRNSMALAMSLMIAGWMPLVRLVEDEQARSQHQRAGDGELLLLPA